MLTILPKPLRLKRRGFVVSLRLTSPKVRTIQMPFFVTVIVWLSSRRSFAALRMTTYGALLVTYD